MLRVTHPAGAPQGGGGGFFTKRQKKSVSIVITVLRLSWRDTNYFRPCFLFRISSNCLGIASLKIMLDQSLVFQAAFVPRSYFILFFLNTYHMF